MTKFENTSQPLALYINGERREVLIEGPQVTLGEALREKLGLTGSKEACRCGECGSCTVLVNGEPVLSCSTLAVSVRDKEITTIEGLSTGGELHPIQQAYVDVGAVQCGFCTPGMVMMTVALLEQNPSPSELEIREWLGGNLCRCTGYVKIVEAVILAAERMGKGGVR